MQTIYQTYYSWETISPFTPETEDVEYRIYTSFKDMLNMTNEIYSANVLSGYSFNHLESILSQNFDLTKSFKNTNKFMWYAYLSGFSNNNIINTYYILKSSDNWTSTNIIDDYYVAQLNVLYDWSYQEEPHRPFVLSNFVNNKVADTRQILVFSTQQSVDYTPGVFQTINILYNNSTTSTSLLDFNDVGGAEIQGGVSTSIMDINKLRGRFITGQPEGEWDNQIPLQFIPTGGTASNTININGNNYNIITDKAYGAPGIDLDGDGYVDLPTVQLAVKKDFLWFKAGWEGNVTIQFPDRPYYNKTIQVKRTCNKYCLYYINRYGGWDWFLINGSSLQKDNITNYNYKTLTNRQINDFAFPGERTQIPYINFEGNQNYLKEYSQTWELNTGWIKESDSADVNELLLSNYVFLHDLENNQDRPIQVNIVNKTNEYKTYKNQNNKLIKYTITVEATTEKYRM